MTRGGWKIGDFALFIALLGCLVLLGVWDNKRTILRNLDEGYDTSAMVTGAHEQHRLPLVFDGFRPRFLDDTYLLDLTWRGRDGDERICHRVPVSSGYMGSLMVGGRLGLTSVPIKVLDEQGAVPAITPDAAARLVRLDGFAIWVRYGTVIAGIVFTVGFGGRWWRRNNGAAIAVAGGSAPAAWHISPRLAMLTLSCVGFAGMSGYYSFKDSRDAAAMRAHGRDAVATVTDLHAELGSDRTISYTIELAWLDGSGTERRFGPTHISNVYARRIAPNGTLVTRQTTVRYLEEDRSARPVIVADADERSRQDWLGQVMTVVLGLTGVVFGILTVRRSQKG